MTPALRYAAPPDEPPRDAAPRVIAPAVAMMVLGLLLAAWQLFTLVMIFAANGIQWDPVFRGSFWTGPMVQTVDWLQRWVSWSGFGGFCHALLLLGVGALVAWGGWSMMRLQRFPLAVLGGVLLVTPWLSPAVVLGIPFGAWALWLLSRRDIRTSFTS